MLKEFKAFILKGNVLDLAVAVIIGAAFKSVVSSLVKDILMPPIGMFLGGVDFKNLTYLLKNEEETAEAVTINYGLFIQSVVDFLIIGLVIFLVVKVYQKMERKKEEAPMAPPSPSNEEVLLGEIRDLLKNK